MMKYYCWAVPLLGAFALAGCDRGPRLYPVSGTVTLDGKPLPEGAIVFLDPDNQIGPDAGKVKDGTFAFKAKAGKKKVEIRAARMQKPPPRAEGGLVGGGEPAFVEYLPERYNDKTQLTADVAADGPNQYEFKLTSK